jgi:hypothetical protein
VNAYCPTCKVDLDVTWENPPYAVTHMMEDGTHVHPETKETVDDGHR